MTLRTIDTLFNDLIKKQMKEEFPLDLTLEGPLLSQEHPKVLRARLEFENNPQQEPSEIELSDFSYQCFASLSAAEKVYPNIDFKFVGRPWTVYQFLTSTHSEALIDFGDLGTAYLSRSKQNLPRGRELQDHILPAWLDYALSSELWGPVGKWPKFHKRMVDLFNEYKLLDEKFSLGYYPLKSPAEKLESFGFIGTHLEKSYLLVLPWTFSLSALNKLEEVIRQEF